MSWWIRKTTSLRLCGFPFCGARQTLNNEQWVNSVMESDGSVWPGQIRIGWWGKASWILVNERKNQPCKALQRSGQRLPDLGSWASGDGKGCSQWVGRPECWRTMLAVEASLDFILSGMGRLWSFFFFLSVERNDYISFWKCSHWLFVGRDVRGQEWNRERG